MAQIQGSGVGNNTNTAMVDDSVGSMVGRVWVNVMGDTSTNYTLRIDYEDKLQPVYMGLAMPGTSTGSPNWQIRKNAFSGTSPELITEVLFGSGNSNFDKVWDSRSGTNESYY